MNKKDYESALKQIMLSLVMTKDHMINQKPSDEVFEFLASAYGNVPIDYIHNKYTQTYDEYYSPDNTLNFEDIT